MVLTEDGTGRRCGGLRSGCKGSDDGDGDDDNGVLLTNMDQEKDVGSTECRFQRKD